MSLLGKEIQMSKSGIQTGLSLAAWIGLPLLAASVLASCATADSALEEKIDEVWGVKSDAVHENGDVIPWQVGQWVRARVDEDGDKGFRMVSIAKKEGTAYWLEVQTVNPYRELRYAALLDGYQPGNLKGLKLVKLLVMDPEGTPVEVGEEEATVPNAELARDKCKALLSLLKHKGALGRVQSVTVVGGTFQDALARPITMYAGGSAWSGSVWYTNAVPILSFAKVDLGLAHAILLKQNRFLEVAEFGTQGAKSEFFP
jgi:hypothetical protein